MQKLNFYPYQFRFKNSENKTLIFDEIRKKFVVLQPEEWVRQHVVQFLIQEKSFPKSLINVEKELMINGLKKRYDIVVYKNTGEILLVVECKAPDILINQKVFDQVFRYNLSLQASVLMVTNGLQHYYAMIDYNSNKLLFMESLPDYKSFNL
ncbi:type I restriction enzyme HsdR N-terminal domain-containing protein [Capnocytophaga canimorsus]|uniref:type I restriction enzyme HsdR N-terminal domain-containing protein n=1 Tax=Capnocytophaga canimorsus TaxID=28188 RepID=UPI000F6C870B|nr:type I restriction enzyme HsdR N-terminal domain-containing protein [Capnocytophaga canimorsus]VEJ18641.1 Type I restriction enzyme R protein N terminus (HSDR_N) [Capnocytophaga canimorsus]